MSAPLRGGRKGGFGDGWSVVALEPFRLNPLGTGVDRPFLGNRTTTGGESDADADHCDAASVKQEANRQTQQ